MVNLLYCIHIFAEGLRTRTAVARLPLRQLSFLVWSSHGIFWCFFISYS